MQIFFRSAVALFLALSGRAQAQENPPPPTSEPAPQGRISVDEKGFSIQAPPGWEVRKDFPNASLLMQVPMSPGTKYQRTIQVMSFSGARFINPVTAKEFEEIIQKRFAAASSSVQDYKVRNHLPIEMQDGRQGMLYYAAFVMEGVPMMQAHILVSSQTRHFLLTFTDLAEHFEESANSPELAEAWTSMTSVALDSPTPRSEDKMIILASIIGGVIVLFFVLILLRNWLARKRLRELTADGVEISDDGDDDVSGSEEAIIVSGEEQISGHSKMAKTRQKTHVSDASKISKYESYQPDSSHSRQDSEQPTSSSHTASEQPSQVTKKSRKWN